MLKFSRLLAARSLLIANGMNMKNEITIDDLTKMTKEISDTASPIIPDTGSAGSHWAGRAGPAGAAATAAAGCSSTDNSPGWPPAAAAAAAAVAARARNSCGTAECTVAAAKHRAADCTEPVAPVSACRSAARVADRSAPSAGSWTPIGPGSRTAARSAWTATDSAPVAAVDGRSGRVPVAPPISA